MALLQGLAGIRQVFRGCKIISVYKIKFETLNLQSPPSFQSSPLITEGLKMNFLGANSLLWDNEGW